MTALTDLQRAVRLRAAVIMPQAAVRMIANLDVAEPRRRSGALHRSRRTRLSIGPSLASLRVEYLAPQANWTDEGTRPHVIRVRRARALRFRAGGRIIFRRQVNHPGNKATKWFRKATSQTAWRRVLNDVTS